MFAVYNEVRIALSCDTTEITKVLPVSEALDSVLSWKRSENEGGLFLRKR